MADARDVQISTADLYWVYRFIDAVELIEQDGICRCDLDAQAPSETNRIRLLLGILQDYALGYSEGQPRLSAVLRELLTCAEESSEPVRETR